MAKYTQLNVIYEILIMNFLSEISYFLTRLLNNNCITEIVVMITLYNVYKIIILTNEINRGIILECKIEKTITPRYILYVEIIKLSFLKIVILRNLCIYK